MFGQDGSHDVNQNMMPLQIRIARPVTNLNRAKTMYCAGLDLRVIGRFDDHAGFDGVMLGRAGLQYHFEFTTCRNHPVMPNPTTEDLTVFYIADAAEWQRASAQMLAAGFEPVASNNPYWDVHGRTFQDPDGYRTVLQNAVLDTVMY